MLVALGEAGVDGGGVDHDADLVGRRVGGIVAELAGNGVEAAVKPAVAEMNGAKFDERMHRVDGVIGGRRGRAQRQQACDQHQ